MPLRHFFIQGNPLTAEGVEKICEAVARCPNLTELRMGGNNMVSSADDLLKLQ